MATKVLPANQQRPGATVGGFWVMLQAWPIANMWTIALLGPQGMRITEGPGPSQWDVVEVPHDVGITQWKGRHNYKAELDLLFDGFKIHAVPPVQPPSVYGPPHLGQGVRYARGAQGVWVEGWIRNLEQLAIKQPGDAAPHSVRIYGAVPHPEVRWVIDNLSWGDYIRNSSTGRRTRQQVTVSLLEYNQPTTVIKLPKPPPPPFFVQKGRASDARPWKVVERKKKKVVAAYKTKKSADADAAKRNKHKR